MGRKRIHKSPIARVDLPLCEAHPGRRAAIEMRMVYEEPAPPETLFEAPDAEEAEASGASVGYSRKYAAAWDSVFGKS